MVRRKERGKRIVLDSSAIAQLRLSAANPYLRKSRKQNPRSVYQYINDKDEQKIGNKLRKWVLKHDRLGNDICAPKGAKKLADNAIMRIAHEQIRKKRINPQDRGKFISQFFNHPHRSQLYRSANSCSEIDDEELWNVARDIKTAFKNWESPESTLCLEE